MWFSGELAYMPTMDGPPERRLTNDEAQESLAAYQGAELVSLARERVTLESQISTLSGVIARFKEPSARKPFIEQIESAQARINAINERLHQIDGAVVSDGG